MSHPTRIDVPVSTMTPDGRTAVYVLADDRTGSTHEPVGSTNERGVLVVDPAAVTDDLREHLGAADPVHLAVTHHHPDHVGGVADLARDVDATVWARAGRAGEFEEAVGVPHDRTFLPGDELSVAGGIRVVDTPGHAPEHVAFGTDDWLVTGDLAVAEGSVVVGGPGADMRAYLSSLRRLHARNPDRLYPAHGPVIEDVRGTCARLLRHRLDRERAVLAAVREGASSTEAILEAAYDKDLTGVRELALATVEAHLRKLAREGTVRWADGEVLPTA